MTGREDKALTARIAAAKQSPNASRTGGQKKISDGTGSFDYVYEQWALSVRENKQLRAELAHANQQLSDAAAIKEALEDRCDITPCYAEQPHESHIVWLNILPSSPFCCPGVPEHTPPAVPRPIQENPK